MNNKLKLIALLGACLVSMTCHNGAAQWIEEVRWEPEFPVEGDSIITTIFAAHAGAPSELLEAIHQQDGTSLITTLYIQHPDFQLAILVPFEVEHGWGELEAGEYLVKVYSYDRFEGEEEYRFFDSLQVLIYVCSPDERGNVFALRLDWRWNWISAPVRPNDPDINAIFSAPISRGSVYLVKEGSGRFCIPEYSFNNITGWNPLLGYGMRMPERSRPRQDLVIIRGERVSPDTPINLRNGWNFISYLPGVEVEAEDAFANIVDVLYLVKDGEGHFYKPEQGYNDMPALRPGKGYFVYVTEDVDFVWNVP